MNTERLLRLAAVMDLVPPRKYDQNSFHSGEVSSRKVSFEPFEPSNPNGCDYAAVIPKEGFCGSSACVLGQAAFEKDMGVFAYVEKDNILTVCGRRQSGDLMIGAFDDEGKLVNDEYRAASIAFDIPYTHASILFGGTGGWETRHFYTGRFTEDGGEWVGPKVVAAKLRAYVVSGGQTAEDTINVYAML
jgi:hypothetical protein